MINSKDRFLLSKLLVAKTSDFTVIEMDWLANIYSID